MKLKNKRVILNVIFIYKTHILYQGVIIMNHYNCIYMYINKINGHSYIGQAKNFNKRHREHICKTNHKYPIDRAFNKYGKDNFKVIILKENIIIIHHLLDNVVYIITTRKSLLRSLEEVEKVHTIRIGFIYMIMKNGLKSVFLIQTKIERMN